MEKFYRKCIELRKKSGAPIEVSSKHAINSKQSLSTIYTPGVGGASKAIHKNRALAFSLTSKSNSVAVISNGSAVLGLGNLGPEAALPVMEGKSALFKSFAGIDAFPLVVSESSPKRLSLLVQRLSPGFGGINLEDISSPECFFLLEELEKKLPIPVFHDDQYGAAIVILAALKNALKVSGKSLGEVKVVVNGIGAAGFAAIDLLKEAGANEIVPCDKNGSLGFDGSFFGCAHSHHKIIAKKSGNRFRGSLKEAMQEADVFIGLSVGGIVSKKMVSSMDKNAIVFALANPVPEIMPSAAKKSGARITATGRSDFPNQINNALVFPGLFRGALDSGAKGFSRKTFLSVSEAISSLVKNPSATKIVPSIFDPRLHSTVATATSKTVIQ